MKERTEEPPNDIEDAKIREKPEAEVALNSTASEAFTLMPHNASSSSAAAAKNGQASPQNHTKPPSVQNKTSSPQSSNYTYTAVPTSASPMHRTQLHSVNQPIALNTFGKAKPPDYADLRHERDGTAYKVINKGSGKDNSANNAITIV